jgi:hypothetical protein
MAFVKVQAREKLEISSRYVVEQFFLLTEEVLMMKHCYREVQTSSATHEKW